MKRVRSLFIIALLVGVLLLGGCTKADSAKWADCNAVFVSTASKYCGNLKYDETGSLNDDNFDKDKYVFRPTKLEATDEKTYVVDLYSKHGYSSNLFATIQADNFDSENETMNFGLLKKGNEYERITYAISNFFSKYAPSVESIEEPEKEAPQSVYTQIYLAVEKLGSRANALLDARKNLETSCANGINQTNDIVAIKNYENYLSKYQELINVLADSSKALQVLLYDYYYFYDFESGSEMKPGQYQRWVDGAILYCGIAYYLKDMKYSTKIQNGFGHPGSLDNQFMDFVAIINAYGDKVVGNDTSSNGIFQYRAAAKKLEGVMKNIDKYEQALAKVLSYLESKNISEVDMERADYSEIRYYHEYTKTFEENIANIQVLVSAFTA